MTKERVNECYNLFLKTYGENSQLNMAIEEMSELTKEICKIIRGKGNIENLTSEIADVEITIEQLKMMFNIEQLDIDKIKDFKIQRAVANINK